MSTLLYAPKREWVGRPMRCPKCTAIIAYDESDLKPTFRPVVVSGRWEVTTQCRNCRAMAYFREMSDEEYLNFMEGGGATVADDAGFGGNADVVTPAGERRGDVAGLSPQSTRGPIPCPSPTAVADDLVMRSGAYSSTLAAAVPERGNR